MSPGAPFSQLVLAASAIACAAGCGASRYEMRGAPAQPFEVAIVPGCPSEEDGSLSRCQKGRALWASRLWELGWASHFITSGSNVYTPYVEAEALAEALVALGVPPERIYLEPNALHTDENMAYSLQIARALGWRRIAVVSNAATFDCLMVRDWNVACSAFTMDLDWVIARAQTRGALLARIRSRRTRDFVPLVEREREIARRSGRHRPASYLLYLQFGILRTNGEHWIPPGMPATPPILNWSTLARPH